MSFLFLKVICLSVLYNLQSCLILFTICKSYKGSSFIMRYSENLSEDYIYFKQEKLWIVKFLVPIQDKESYIRLMVVYWIQPPQKFCIFIDVTISGEWNSLNYTMRLWPFDRDESLSCHNTGLLIRMTDLYSRRVQEAFRAYGSLSRYLTGLFYMYED